MKRSSASMSRCSKASPHSDSIRLTSSSVDSVEVVPLVLRATAQENFVPWNKLAVWANFDMLVREFCFKVLHVRRIEVRRGNCTLALLLRDRQQTFARDVGWNLVVAVELTE